MNRSALRTAAFAILQAPTGNTAFTVVGVASDTRFRELEDVGPVAYFDWEQVDNGFPGLLALQREPDRPAR